MTRYRVGVSGLRRGVSLARVFALIPDCDVAAGCDPDAGRLQGFAEQFPQATLHADYADMLAQGVDIAVVATAPHLHCEQSIAALEAGCHVLQEVPLGDSVEHCRDLLNAVSAHPNRKFMLAENCCYWADILSWKEMYRQGMLGKLTYAEAEYIHDVRSAMRSLDGQLTWRASLPPIHYCTHSLGPLLWITGERCVQACGMASPSQLEQDLDAPDVEVALLRTASGAVIKILCGFQVVREPSFHYYSIYGTKGCLELARPPYARRTNAYLDSVPHLHSMVSMPLDKDIPRAPPGASAGGHGTAEYEMVRAFVASIRAGTRPPIDIHFALLMSLPGLCAHHSALQGGQPVAVPDWRELDG